MITDEKSFFLTVQSAFYNVDNIDKNIHQYGL